MDACSHFRNSWIGQIHRWGRRALALVLAISLFGADVMVAQTGVQDSPISEWERLRLVYIPFSELPAVLTAPQERVLLSRDEIVRLLGNRAPEQVVSPNLVVWRSAQYQVELDGQVGSLQAKLVVESLADQAIPVALPWQNLTLRSLKVNGESPLVYRNGEGQWFWLIPRPGKYDLELDAQFVVRIDGERQAFSFRLPEVATSNFSVLVPGNVDVLAGPPILSREFQEEKNVTRLELAAGSGATELLLTLNNRYRTNQLLWTCRQLLLGDIRPDADRWEMIWEPRVMQGKLPEIRAAIPTDLEIVNVSGESVKQWQMLQENGGRTLKIQLHENTQSAPIHLSGLRSRQQPIGPEIYDWKAPVLNAEGAAYQPRMILVQAELDLWLSEPKMVDQHAIDLSAAAPLVGRYAEMFPALRELNRPEKHRMASFSVVEKPELQIPIRKAPTVFSAVATHICELNESRWLMTSAWQLQNSGDAKFQLNLELPVGVRILKVRDEAGELAHRFVSADNINQVEIDLRQGLGVSRALRVIVESEFIPENWFGNWAEISESLRLPQLTGLDEERGVVAVGLEDRFSLNSVAASEMRPLGRDDLKTYRLGELNPIVAYEFENQRPRIDLVLGKKTAQRVVEAATFVRFEPTHRAVHGELIIDVRNVAAKQFSVELPSDAPETVSFACDSENEIVERKRRENTTLPIWDLTLGREVLGNLRLLIDYEVPGSSETMQATPLTPIRLVDADLQTMVASVEGSADIDVAVPESLVRLPLDELQNTTYQPGRYLIGVFDLTNQIAAVQLTSQMRQMAVVPTAVIEEAANQASIGGDGQVQVHASWRLKTTFPKLLLQLPADCQLWSLHVNGEPQTAKRVGSGTVVSFAHGDGGSSQMVSFVYSTELAPQRNSSQYGLVMPRLEFPADEATEPGAVPVLRTIWKVQGPAGFRVIDSRGNWNVVDDERLTETWWQRQRSWMQWGVATGGDVVTKAVFGWRLSPMTASRGVQLDSSSRDDMPSIAIGGQASRPVMPITALPGESVPNNFDADRFSSEQLDEISRSRRTEEAVALPPASGELPQLVPPPATMGKPLEAKSPMTLGVQGFRSLTIANETNGPSATFEGLGLKSGIDVTLVNRRLSDAVAAILVVCVVLFSLCLTKVSLSAKLGWLIVWLVMSVAGVWIHPVMPEVGSVLEKLIWVPVLLIVLHIVRAILLAILRGLGRLLVRWGMFRRLSVGTALMIAICGASPSLAATQDDANNVDERGHLKLVPPLVVDDRVVLIPYDPQQREIMGDQQWLFSKRWYDELRAVESKTPEIKMALPEELILPSLNWDALVQGDRSVRFTANIELALPDEQWRRIPVGIEGGVFVSASINGEPVALLPAKTENKPENSAPSDPNQMQLLVRGPGPQQIQLVIEYAINKLPGGWRVNGRLPMNAAAQVNIASGELIGTMAWSSQDLRLSHDLKPDSPFPPVAIHSDGQFQLNYRSPAMRTDLSRQNAVVWFHQIVIRPTQTHWSARVEINLKEANQKFTLELPSGAMIEKVECANLKSWARSSSNENRIDVELLAAANRETLLLEWSLPAIAELDPSGWQLQMPQFMDVAEASGVLEIYRSDMLALTATDLVSIYREDFPDETQSPPVWSTWQNELEPAIGFQRYRFDRQNATLRIGSTPVGSGWKVRHTSILETELAKTTLEAKVVISPVGQSSHDLVFTTPNGLSIEEMVITPAMVESSRAVLYQIDKMRLADGRQRWHFRFNERQTQPLAMIVRGKLGAAISEAVVWQPIVIENAADQRYEYALGASAALSVDVVEPEQVDFRLPAEMTAWLQSSRLPTIQKAWAADSPQHRLKLRAQRLPAEVQFESISDVSITTRAIEHTVLLEWKISRAGIEQVEFVLPQVWSEAKMDGPWISRVNREPSGNEQVKFTVFLQDRILGEYRLALSLDQPLSVDNQKASLPINLTGTTRNRWLTVQNSGRFEVDVQPGAGLESVNRQQARFRELESKLGAVFVTQAYAATSIDGAPQVSWKTMPRTSISTVTASVRFSVTDLMLDRSGYYLAKQRLMINNRTEQVLELELPEGARLLSLQVDSQPTRPLRVPNAAAQLVSIPLVKSSELNLDYSIEVVYEGLIEDFAMLREMDLPLAMTRNIESEVSHVYLRLPAELRALQFLGTMTQVKSGNDLTDEFQDYQQQILRSFQDSIQSGGAYKVDPTELKRLDNLIGSISGVDGPRPDSWSDATIAENSKGKSEELLRTYRQLKDYASNQPQSQSEPEQVSRSSNRFQLQSLVEQQFNQNEMVVQQNMLRNFAVLDDKKDQENAADKKPGANQSIDRGSSQSAALGFKKESSVNQIQLGQGQSSLGEGGEMRQDLSRQDANVDLALIAQNEKMIAEFNQSRSSRVGQGDAVQTLPDLQQPVGNLSDELRDSPSAGTGGAFGGGGFGGGGRVQTGGQGPGGSRQALPGADPTSSLGLAKSKAAESAQLPAAESARHPGLVIDINAQGETFYFRVPKGKPQLSAQFVEQLKYQQFWSTVQIGVGIIAVAVLALIVRRRTSGRKH